MTFFAWLHRLFRNIVAFKNTLSVPSASPKRAEKEQKIIDAAEIVFLAVGYANAKMEEVAAQAKVSKGTVYFYFDTKENLYMAVTYRAINTLNDFFYRTLDVRKGEPGLEVVLSLAEAYVIFCAKHFLYAEVILDYMTLNRSTKDGKDRAKLTEALRDSIYYRMVQGIQNLSISLITGEIIRGVEDGSIRNRQKPELLYLIAWAAVTGFVKLNVAAGSHRQTLLGVQIDQWKDYQMRVLRDLLLREDSIETTA